MESSIILPVPMPKATRDHARRYTCDEWETVKPTIQDLYLQQQKTLKQLMDILKQESGFIASEKQLKSRITKWGFNVKNVKGDIMIKIARTRLKRRRLEGKESAFRVNQKLVAERNIIRYLKRNHFSEDDLLSMASPIDPPSPDFSIFTPRPNTPSNTDALGESHPAQDPTLPSDQLLALVVSSDLKDPDDVPISEDPACLSHEQVTHCTTNKSSALTTCDEKFPTSRGHPFWSHLPRHIQKPPGSPEMLLLRFREQICPMLSITHGQNNLWQTLVLPLVRESKSLFEAISAMAALHKSTDTKFRTHGELLMMQSILSVNHELSAQTPSITTLATILILSFWTRWDQGLQPGRVHLMGAKALLRAVCSRYRQGVFGPLPHYTNSLFAFLYDTCCYMDSLTRLGLSTIGTHQYRTFTFPDFGDITQQNPVPGSHHNLQVDPWMGYARSLLPLMGRTADLCEEARTTETNSPGIVEKAAALKCEIEGWSPDSNILLRSDGSPMDRECLVPIAEAYRHATILYLCQVVPEILATSTEKLASTIFARLSSVPPSSKVSFVQIYPLFVAGCEACNEEERQWVEERWAGMMARMKVKNVDKCWEITQEVWRRRDAHRKWKNRNGVRLQQTSVDLSREAVEGLDPEFSVRGRLHWACVMKDWQWEVSF